MDDAPADGLRIEINWPRTEREEKGQKKPNRILGMLDCLCLAAPGALRPTGLLKPGQDHRSNADRAAAACTFALPEAAGPERQRVALDGGWELANWDEDGANPADRLGPVQGLPDLAALRWFSMTVPGDRNQAHPEFVFHHRFLLRTRVQVPTSQAGRSFHLDIQRFSAIASVFVNGRLCAWSKNHSTTWQPDITAGIRPGQSNEIVVAVKDRYYSVDADKDPTGWRSCWNLPDDFLTSNQGVASRHQLAIAADPTCGLTEPVALVAAGPVYLADAFVKTSVQRQELAAELTLANPGAAPRTVSMACSVVPWSAAGAVAPVKTLAPIQVTIDPGASRTVEIKDTWADPQLWWPDDVHLYQLVTTISVDGRPIDTARTRFGFREWTWDSSVFRLNGVKWQSWADLDQNYQPQELVRDRGKTGRNLIRLWSNGGLGKMTRREVLDYCDEHGVLVRESGTFDGQLANYSTGLTEETVVDGKKLRMARQVLFVNWTEQLKAWTRASRNHPSLFIWSAENEVTYINSANLGQRDQVEPAIRAAIRDGIQALDPTRPVMVDGGNALTDESMPVNGGHYTEFDNNAYVSKGRQPAWFAGPGDLSGLPGGEQTFAGVRFRLADFTTSPVPSAFMLRGRAATVKDAEITGLAIKRSADALFLLHTCAKSSDIDNWEHRVNQARQHNSPVPENPVMMTYRVRYDDGQTAEIPVRWGLDIGAWAVKEPQALPNAALAWAAPLAEAKAGEQAVVWMMQWTNPRPATAIASIDLVAGEEKWGAAAVLGVTTASVRR